MGNYLKLLLLGVFCLLLPISTKAVVPINELSVEANLQKDGSVAVTQIVQFAAPTQLDWKFFSNIHSLTVTADGEQISSKYYRISSSGGNAVFHSAKLATSWKLRYTTTTTLIRHDDRDQIFFQIFQTPGRAIFDISVRFSLPDAMGDPDLQGNPYAIGGVNDLRKTISPDKNSVEFTAGYAGPNSLLTVSANWSKNVLSLSHGEELRLSLLNLEILPWLTLGVFLPLLSLIVLWTIIARQRESERQVKEVSSRMPSTMSAILVGVLVEKKIYPREIVALLVELCQKGYLVIVQKSNDYYLSQRKPVDENLEPWERDILEQLFPTTAFEVGGTELQSANNQSLFSPKVRDAFSRIYEVITEKKFFSENPHHTRVRYKLFALLLYFVSSVGLVWMAVTSTSPYLVIPLGAVMAISFITIRLSPKLVRYSREGLAARNAWIAFGNFLAKPESLPLEATRDHTFEKVLPYAIALDKTHEWGKRFDLSSTVIVRPDWFVTYKETTTTQFVDEIFNFTESISESLTNLRGPLVN